MKGRLPTLALLGAVIRRAPRYAFVVLALGIVISIAITSWVRLAAEQDAITRAAFAADQLTARIEERLSAYALILRGGAALFESSAEVTRDEWLHFTRKLEASNTVVGIQGVGFARLIAPAALEARVAALRAEGFPDYRVWPEGEREFYTAIEYLEPFSGRNLRAFGYDMFSEPVRRAAMERARDTGMAALTGRVQLVQETGESVQAGTLMYVPVYSVGSAPESVAERRAALIGWTYSPYRMTDLMSGILMGWSAPGESPVVLTIHDGMVSANDSLLYADPANAVVLPPTWLRQVRTIRFNANTWLLQFDHLDPVAGVQYGAAWLTLAGGSIVSLLLFALLATLANTRDRANAMAEKLTATISGQRAEMRDLLQRLQTIADRVPGMVFEYCRFADGSSCFPYSSEGIRVVYRVTPEQVMQDASAVFAIIHPDDLDGVVASIDYSATHLTPWRHEYRVRFADGTERWLYGDSLPHATTGDSVTWYGVITDITERKLSELTLRAAHAETERFRLAMDHLSSYVYMKDRESRYTYGNRAALEMFNVAPEELPGSSDYDFFPAATVRRLHQIDARVLAGEQTTEEVDVLLSDGAQRFFLEIKTPIFDLENPEIISGVLGISTDITAIKQHEEQLQHIAHYDALTDLPNRVLLADRLQQAMAQAQRREHHLAVVYLDLDSFKAINDRHGHAAGDQLLITIASRMRAILRDEDTLARLGGDEFVAVLLGFSDVESSAPLLARLLEAAALPLVVDGRTLEVSASIGVTFYPQPEQVVADQLLRQADQAMYQAKLAGKGRYHVFDADLDRDLRGRHERIENIRRAFENDEFRLFYQPKVNMQTGEVLGAEALLRWQHPERGVLAPGQFLPLIEDHPIMLDLGRWVVRTALAQINEWQEAGRRLTLSINISGLELRDPNFVQHVQMALQEFPQVPPQLLELEVLETSALGDLGAVSRLLASCRELGVGVALDDFGTGYSSLTYLKQLPAGLIKIDQSFVRDILDDPEDIAIFSGVLGISEAFGRKVLAEGVETVEHGVMLLRLGCKLGQGYGIAYPMPAAYFLKWLGEWVLPPQWSGLRRLGQENLPLLYATVEHRRWVQDVAASVNNLSCPWPELELERSKVSLWLRDHRFSAARFRVQIQQLHSEAHEQAQGLFALCDKGDQAGALAGLDELYRIRDELVATLQNYVDVLAA